MPVGRLQEDVHLDGRSSGPLHRGRIIAPLVGAGQTVDAGDDGDARPAGFGDEPEALLPIAGSEVTLEVLPGIAHARLRRGALQRRGMMQNLLFEDRLEDDGAGTVAHALPDIVRGGRVGRAGDDDRRSQLQSEVGGFHDETFSVRIIRRDFRAVSARSACRSSSGTPIYEARAARRATLAFICVRTGYCACCSVSTSAFAPTTRRSYSRRPVPPGIR